MLESNKTTIFIPLESISTNETSDNSPMSSAIKEKGSLANYSPIDSDEQANRVQKSVQLDSASTNNTKNFPSTSGTLPSVHSGATTQSIITIMSVVLFYIVSSITMVLLNKTILNQTGLPLIFLWGQLVVAVVLIRLAGFLGILTIPPISAKIFWTLLPLIGVNVVGLTLNTLCLHNIDAVLYQVARSLILPITVLISIVSLHQHVTGQIAIACTIISTGFIVGVAGERSVHVSTTGIVFGILSSVTTAIHSVVIKHAFTSIAHNGAFDLVYYNNFFSAIILFPILLWERSAFQMLLAEHGTVGLKILATGTALAGASGLLINLAGFLQIKVTSPVTHTVSSAARGVLQTIAARMFLGESITISRTIGISVTLFGSCLYSYFKAIEGQTEYRKIDSATKNSNVVQ